MNTVAIVIVAALVGFSYQDNPDHAKFREKMHQDSQECAQQTGVDPDTGKKAFHDGEFPDNKNTKCFIKCMYEKSGHMDASGKIDFSKFESHIPPSADKAKVSEIVKKCSQLKSDDTCQLAYDVAKCMREAWTLAHPK